MLSGISLLLPTTFVTELVVYPRIFLKLKAREESQSITSSGPFCNRKINNSIVRERPAPLLIKKEVVYSSSEVIRIWLSSGVVFKD
jgi:hypothetical protein